MLPSMAPRGFVCPMTQVDITWYTHCYGREGQLGRLNRERNDYNLPYHRRHAANKTLAKIIKQCSDKRLMAMRERLIKATQAGDYFEAGKIGQQMRAYLGEDLESGVYGQ